MRRRSAAFGRGEYASLVEAEKAAGLHREPRQVWLARDHAKTARDILNKLGRDEWLALAAAPQAELDR